jgi:hypothetical protein
MVVFQIADTDRLFGAMPWYQWMGGKMREHLNRTLPVLHLSKKRLVPLSGTSGPAGIHFCGSATATLRTAFKGDWTHEQIFDELAHGIDDTNRRIDAMIHQRNASQRHTDDRLQRGEERVTVLEDRLKEVGAGSRKWILIGAAFIMAGSAVTILAAWVSVLGW